MYKASFYTLGCKVSLYETEAVAEKFEKLGFQTVPFGECADVTVINTCTVTAESDAKSRKYIRRAHRISPDGKIIVVGCYSQRAPSEVASLPGVACVLGTKDKMTAPDIALSLLSGELTPPIVNVTELSGADFEPMQVKSPKRTRGFVKIEDGCECKCTYCAISAARGPVRSKPREDVLREVSHLYGAGVGEVVLTGIETASYGADFKEKYTLGELITDIGALCPNIRVRLGSMAPELLTRDFIDKVSAESCMVPHFHISMQSASDKILRLMKRRYSLKMALDNIDYAKEKMPRLMLTADLMVGFPGEDDEDFQATLDFVSRAGLLSAHVFAYSRRDGTPAASYDRQIPDTVKRERSRALIKECQRVGDGVLRSVVESGEMLHVIFEEKCDGGYIGHSDSYIEVVAECERDVSGELHAVIPESHRNGIIYGKIADFNN